MLLNVKHQQVENLKTNKFLIQLDESMVSDKRGVLIVYDCFINNSCKLCQEMLFAKLLETATS